MSKRAGKTTPARRKKTTARKAEAVRRNGKRGGRPRVEINWKEFDKLCEFQCTQEEIAAWFGCCADTVQAAVKREHGIGFSEYFAKKRGRGKIALRRAQMQNALGGNTTMQIFLGKQYLGQADKQEVSQPEVSKAAVLAEVFSGLPQSKLDKIEQWLTEAQQEATE